MPTVYVDDKPKTTPLALSPHTHKPFTDETWENHRTRGISPDDRYRDGRESPLHHSWMRQSDLEYELWHLAPYLTMDACRALVSGACNGLPIRLTWQYPNGNRTTAVGIINQLFAPSKSREWGGSIYFRQWGGSAPIPMSYVVDATVDHSEFSWGHEPLEGRR